MTIEYLTNEERLAICQRAFDAGWTEVEPKKIEDRWFWFVTRAGDHISEPSLNGCFWRAKERLDEQAPA